MAKQTWKQKLNIFMGTIKAGDRMMVQKGAYEGEWGTVVYLAGNVTFRVDDETPLVYLAYADLCPR
jgi:hypothetical protein